MDALWQAIQTNTVSQQEAYALLDTSSQLFLQDSSLVKILEPCIIVGNIKGQVESLQMVLDKCEKNKYLQKGYQILFIGGMAGKFPKALLALAWLKVTYPKQIYVLRSIYEAGSMTRIYGDRDAFKKQFGVRGHSKLDQFFATLPPCALLAHEAFVTPRGIAMEIMKSLQYAAEIKRPQCTPDYGLLYDMLQNEFVDKPDNESCK